MFLWRFLFFRDVSGVDVLKDRLQVVFVATFIECVLVRIFGFVKAIFVRRNFRKTPVDGFGDVS